jgi:hypothetical protein
MVHDECDGVVGFSLDKCVVKDCTHVGVRGGRNAVEVLYQWRIEEIELVVHLGKVVGQGVQRHVPEFADEELQENTKSANRSRVATWKC